MQDLSGIDRWAYKREARNISSLHEGSEDGRFKKGPETSHKSAPGLVKGDLSIEPIAGGWAGAPRIGR